MQPQEIAFLQQIKSVGIERARELFSCVAAWEGMSDTDMPEAPPTLHVSAGKKVMALLPKPKKAGRKVDPNSVCQRVWASIRRYLDKHGESNRQDVLTFVQTDTGLSEMQIATNAASCPGIKRDYGKWSVIVPKGPQSVSEVRAKTAA